MTSSPELVLHIWPSRWDLPTFTAECLASVIYLQLAIPGEFVVEESINPDLSPNGALNCELKTLKFIFIDEGANLLQDSYLICLMEKSI